MKKYFIVWSNECICCTQSWSNACNLRILPMHHFWFNCDLWGFLFFKRVKMPISTFAIYYNENMRQTHWSGSSISKRAIFGGEHFRNLSHLFRCWAPHSEVESLCKNEMIKLFTFLCLAISWDKHWTFTIFSV